MQYRRRAGLVLGRQMIGDSELEYRTHYYTLQLQNCSSS